MTNSRHIFHAKAQRRKEIYKNLCAFATLHETSFFHLFFLLSLFLFFSIIGNSCLFADDFAEQTAFLAAVERAAPSVVRLETVGGDERAEGVAFGDGPASGLLLDAEGHVVSSQFNFLRRPDSILVRFPDGRRKPARLLATDHSRKLVLLKIELDDNEKNTLVPTEFAEQNSIRVGQWAIALGRAFDAEQPNVSVGIVSALSRIWGKALQTDAKTSPNNYGGPLIDIQGRVIGVITPLTPSGESAADALAWYDSGIGFAIPAADVLRSVERLKQGRDLHPGFLGVAFKGPNPSTSEAVLGACPPDSPAAKSGLKPGDRILSIDGRKTARAADVLAAVNRVYAGDKITVSAVHDGREFQAEIELGMNPKENKKENSPQIHTDEHK